MELQTTESIVVKVCMVGDSGVGKSSIAVRFVRDVFYSNLHPTLGVGYLTRCLTDEKGTPYKFQIWDTAGQERYRSLVPIYYQGAAVILIVYDVTNRESLMWGAARWMSELRKTGPPNAIYVLVGNKADYGNPLREVTEEEGILKAKEMGAIYYETSAKSGYNITELFKKLTSSLEENNFRALSEQATTSSSDDKTQKDCNFKLSFFGKQLSSGIEALKLRFSGNERTSESSCCGKIC